MHVLKIVVFSITERKDLCLLEEINVISIAGKEIIHNLAFNCLLGLYDEFPILT